MKDTLPKRADNFSGWYNQVVQKGELADYGPASGTMVIRPYGYALWENVVDVLDKDIKKAGVQNTSFPLFIPMDLINKEEDHIKGFSPHLAVVTHGGGKELAKPLAVRPTSETIMYPFFSKWIKSHRDLPLLINQWCNVVRWELRTTLFLRTTEFLWQEGHTAHATHEESWKEVRRAISMYEKTYRESLAIPGYTGKKSQSEKFAGADDSTTVELLMPDGKALQGCTAHDLGTNFSKPFDIAFQGEDGQKHYAWQTSWGWTTRSIGALIMVHGDDKGLRFPPRIAPIQTIVVPIEKKNSVGVQEESSALFSALEEAGIRVKLDNGNETPGSKFHKWEMRGVPIRIEIGQGETDGDYITVYRRDNDTKERVNKRDIVNYIPVLLEEIQANMLAQAEKHLKDNTHDIETYDQFKAQMKGDRGMIRAFWCEDANCEAKIKEETKANTRCLPFDAPEEHGQCVCCGKDSQHRWFFAQPY